VSPGTQHPQGPAGIPAGPCLSWRAHNHFHPTHNNSSPSRQDRDQHPEPSLSDQPILQTPGSHLRWRSAQGWSTPMMPLRHWTRCPSRVRRGLRQQTATAVRSTQRHRPRSKYRPPARKLPILPTYVENPPWHWNEEDELIDSGPYIMLE